MANGRSCCCAGLSKGWWWLLTLLGLPFLYFLMLSAKWDPIEKDIQSRTQQKLASSDAAWSNVEIEKRGRDVLLTGTAASDEVRDKAIQTALAVDGVRIVEDSITVKSLTSPSLQAHYENGKYILEGTLASQKEIDALTSALADKVGAENIINKLTVGDGYANTGGAMTIAGKLMDQESLDNSSSAFKTVAAALGLTLTNNLSLDLDAIAAKKAADEAALAKKMAEEAAAAEEAKKVAEEEAAAKEAEAMAQKAEEEKAAADAQSQQSEAEKAALAKKAEAEKAAAEQLAEEQRRAERMVAAKADVEACQTKLNNTMTGKTILFDTNKAHIQKASFALLTEITTVISECRSKVPDSKIVVSGHTDSRGSDAYNMALSQRRADAVKAYLINAGVDTSIITSTGYGETQPIAPNDTREGRAKNRRITFSIQ